MLMCRLNAHPESIMHGEEDSFAKELRALSEQPLFDLAQFEAVIDKIRTHVAEVSSASS